MPSDCSDRGCVYGYHIPWRSDVKPLVQAAWEAAGRPVGDTSRFARCPDRPPYVWHDQSCVFVEDGPCWHEVETEAADAE